MKRYTTNVRLTLWLVLTAMTGTLGQAQPPAPRPIDPAIPQTASPWYGRYPSDAIQSHPAEDKDPCVACCSPCPRVYGYAEAMFLERGNSSFDQPVLVQREIGTPVATFLSTPDLQFDYEPAARVVLGFRLHDGWALEGGYFDLWEADATAYVAPGVPLTLPDGLGEPPAANVWSSLSRTWVDYSSDLQSAELNLVYCCGGCGTCGADKNGYAASGHFGVNSHSQTFEWLVGFRYLDLSEEFRIYGEKDVGDPPGIESGVYDIRTGNELYGGQLGARFRCWGQRLGFEATGKLGVFGNDADQEQYVTDYPDSFPLRPTTTATGGQVAFLGDLNLTAIYRLNEIWSLRAGYNLIWISGVALAPDQLDFSGELPAGNQISSSGGVFLHGVSCGLEARW